MFTNTFQNMSITGCKNNDLSFLVKFIQNINWINQGCCMNFLRSLRHWTWL